MGAEEALLPVMYLTNEPIILYPEQELEKCVPLPNWNLSKGEFRKQNMAARHWQWKIVDR